MYVCMYVCIYVAVAAVKEGEQLHVCALYVYTCIHNIYIIYRLPQAHTYNILCLCVCVCVCVYVAVAAVKEEGLLHVCHEHRLLPALSEGLVACSRADAQAQVSGLTLLVSAALSYSCCGLKLLVYEA
jgi:hypothetical protein